MRVLVPGHVPYLLGAVWLNDQPFALIRTHKSDGYKRYVLWVSIRCQRRLILEV